MAAENIFQQYLQPVRSVADYSADMDKQEQNGLSLAASRLQNQTGQQSFADDQAYRQAAKDSAGDTNKLIKALNSMGLAKKAQEIQQFGLANAKTQADTALANAHAKNFGQTTDAGAFKLAQEKRQQQASSMAALQSPDDAIAYITKQVQGGVFTPEQGQAAIQSVPKDPAEFARWQLGHLKEFLSPKDQIDMGTAKPTEITTGQQKYFVDNNPNSPTFGKQIGASPVQMQTTPDAQLHSDTSIKTTGMTNATSSANNAANIAKDYVVNGINKDGSPTGDMEVTAKAIASGQLPPPSGMALTNPKNQRILSRVMEINPQYDYTEVAAKKAAATSFATGQLGNALRSVSTANAHLDQMNELVDALGNGNTQVINKVNNWYQAQTGNPAPTNFNAIKNVVGQEVVKAIVAGGGGVGEREEAAKAFSTANSPAQLKEAIQHYRMVMGAQSDNLLAQRDAAGLSRSTLPNYNGAKAAADSGAPSKDAIAAEVARRAALAKKSPGAGMR
ncbi:hypothetical protein UFOVP92_41 [uncultured Caudovirales phage]|uniref:Uncharacterized protein n=1 Tax=uncultured Caudovirales phage TaxID=2100421 RepID=A0A6J5L6Q5_9CAUD|nr:hypothetical protein UFOVP92_41 [uncultured Caudovirales phage]